MAQLFDPRYQAVDANGLPYAGAQLAFYEAGTTTEITIYQDSDGSTPHTNPVVADSAGKFPSIFLDLSGPYKFILATAAGVVLDTLDDILAEKGVTDGDKGDVIVSGGGDVWTLDPAITDQIDGNSDSIDDLEASLAALSEDVSDIELEVGARVYINAAGTYVLDAGDNFPAVHYVDVNGAVVLDVSALQTFETYAIAINDFAATSVIVDTGLGNTVVGSGARDGFTASQAIQLRGGESIIICRITGSAFVLLGGVGNPDIYRLTGATDVRMWEQPDGRYDVYFERNATLSTDTNFDVAVGGKTIDFTNAVLVSARIREDNTTSRSPMKLRSLGNTGAGGGRAIINNPNATTLTVGIYLTDVEVTV